ncbi:MAG: recombinase family protein [Aestuariivirga sp.]|nr:recombinase family protein [Aestuariivirga sp.]
MAEVPALRCAIYTRTSSDEGLIQDYNSLAAQRDACAAYIVSQKHEGWVRTRRVYEDGGYSGGNLDRPALRDLFEDMALGGIDIVVIYKIDRLTRSLRDFARLSETFSRHNASFVAVTQQFNTASSMGRLTLNILLTFAQFEREMAGDRIRDKKAASTRLGIWMGGNPALGYDAPAKKLVVNPAEADAVRYIFRRFVELESMAELQKDLVRAGIVSKRRVRKGDQPYGGVNLTWHPLHKILTNPLYKGVIRQNGQSFTGRHEPIIDARQFDRVQKLVRQVADREKAKRALAYPSLLRGIIFDMAGEPLYTRHTLRKSVKYNYYFSRSLAAKAPVKKPVSNPDSPLRLSAPAVEKLVVQTLAKHLRDRQWLESTVPTVRRLRATLGNAQELAAEVERQLASPTGLIRQLLTRVELNKVTLRLFLNRRWLFERLDISPQNGPQPYGAAPVVITINNHPLRCGNDLRFVFDGPSEAAGPDHRMVREILRAIRWFDALSSGAFDTIQELAEEEGVCAPLITDRIRLAFLAPDIVEMILEGRQPASMTIGSLRRARPLPMSWPEQRRLLLGDKGDGDPRAGHLAGNAVELNAQHSHTGPIDT